MKKILPFFVCLVACVCFVFAGCSTTQTKTFETPSAAAQVNSNGGLAVAKGDYVYFVGGFEKNTAATKDYSVKQGAIYKAVLVDGKLDKIEKFVNKVCGYQYGGLYIFGDRLFYTTPEVEKDGAGKVRNDLLKLESIKLDGSDCKTHYVTESAFSSTNWVNFFQTESKLYAVVYNDAKIIRIDIKNNNQISVLEDENITNAVYANGRVAFAQTVDSQNGLSTSGNIIKLVDVATKDVETIKDFTQDGKSASLKSAEGDMLVCALDGMTIAFDLETGSQSTLFVGDLSSYYFTDGEKTVFKYGKKLYAAHLDGSIVLNDSEICDEDATLGLVYDQNAYYVANKKLLRKKLVADSVQEELGEIGTLTTDMATDFDVVTVGGVEYVLLASKTADKADAMICACKISDKTITKFEFDAKTDNLKIKTGN